LLRLQPVAGWKHADAILPPSIPDIVSSTDACGAGATGSSGVDDRPNWFDALADAASEEQWIATLFDVPEAALLGLLRRAGASDLGLRSARVQEIQRALAEHQLALTDLAAWRQDVADVLTAVDGLKDFHQRWSLVQTFRSQYGLPTGDLESVTGEIRNALWRGDLPLQTWVEFLDDHREEVDKDIFVYRVPPEQLGALRRWAENVSDELHHLGFDAQCFLWRPAQPALARAVVEAGVLRLRWVGWRRFENEQTIDMRCLTFVRVDLQTGAVEMQLQHVDRGGMHALAAERDQYVRAVAALLPVTPEPVRLEPAMRVLMADDRLTLDSWRLRTPTGGILRGSRQADLFAKVKAGFATYYALEFAGDWKPTPDAVLRLKMDARTDAITIPEQGAPERAKDIIALVREQTAVPEEEAREPSDASSAEQRALVEKLVAYERRLGRTDIPVNNIRGKETTSDLLATPATLEEALGKVGVRFLGAMLYVLCPNTQTPVQQDGRDVQFERLADVPDEILCENESGEPQRHATKGNAWLRVGHRPPAGTFYLIYSAWTAFLLFLPLATWFFTWLRALYPDQRWFITGGYLVSLVAPLAAIVRIYGRRNVQAAARLLQLFMPRRPPSGSKDVPAENTEAAE
jgi:hypothetical protein